MNRIISMTWANKLGRWQTHAIGAVMLVAMTAAAFFVELGPLMNQQHRKSDMESLATERNARLRTLAADLKRTNEQVASSQKYVREAQLVLQPRSKLNDRLAAITELAAGCGLQTDGIEPGAETPGVHFATVSIRLNARGSAAQCMKFLAAVRTKLPDDPVAAVEMSSTPTARAEPIGPCSFEIVWYTANPRAVANR